MRCVGEIYFEIQSATWSRVGGVRGSLQSSDFLPGQELSDARAEDVLIDHPAHTERAKFVVWV